VVPWVDHVSEIRECLLWFRLVVHLLWIRTVDTHIFVHNLADAAVEVLGLVNVPSLCPILLHTEAGRFCPKEMDRELIVVRSIENTFKMAVVV
jgi:hypothetical protein